MSGPTRLGRFARVILSATVLGGLLAAGLPVAASAAETHTLTVTVRNVTGTPLAGMTVLAIPVADGKEIQGDRAADGSYKKATAVKGRTGVYTFASLGDFDHTLYFGTVTSTTFAQLLGGASDIDRAQVIPAGQKTLSVSLATNAVITGTVKNPAGKVLAKALVTAYYYNGSDWQQYSSALSDAKGKYTLKDIDPGSYRLSFRTVGRDYSILYSGGAAKFDDAAGIVVGVGTTTTANATFSTFTGAISGQARVWYDGYSGYGDFPMAGARAIAYPVIAQTPWYDPPTVDFEHGVASATTGNNGNWVIKNLPAGKYVVAVSPGYYNQALTFVGGPSLGNASVLTVTAGVTTKTQNSSTRQTDRGASLAVTVKDQAGVVVAGADVLLQSRTEPEYYFRGTTNVLGVVSFGKSGKYHTIQPDLFDVVVTTNGAWAPKRSYVQLNDGPFTMTVNLALPAQPAGFVTQPTIAETALTAGTTYTVAAQAKRATAILSYQWLRDGRPIYGADRASYLSRTADTGTVLSVRVSSSEFGYATDTASASVVGAIVSSEILPINLTPPTVTPSTGAFVGSTINIVPGRWSVTGLDFEYSWTRDGQEFEHAGPTYIVQLSDLGTSISGSVVTKKQGHPDASAVAVTSVTPVFGPATELRESLTVTSTTKGVPKKSTKYTVTPGTWTAPSPVFSFEWLRGGVVVGTGASFIEKPTAVELTLPLDVRVNATADGFDPGTATTQARKASAALASSAAPVATLVGSPTPLSATSPVEFLQSATVSTGDWIHGSDEVGVLNYSYQWIRKVGKAKAAAIKGATKATYAPVIGDIGAVLSVKVTARSTRWAESSVTVASGIVAPSRALESLSLTVPLSGGASVDRTLDTYLPDVWDTAGIKRTYQWWGCALPKCTADSPVSAFTKIAKATRWSIMPPAAYANGRIFVVVTATKAGHRPLSVSSHIADIGAKGSVSVIKRPVILYGIDSVKVHDWVKAESPTFSYTYSVFESVWEVCSADCLTPNGVWTPAVGITDRGAFSPSGVNIADGATHLRVTTRGKSNPSGNYTLPASSDPIRLLPNVLTAFSINDLTANFASSTGIASLKSLGSFPSFATYTQRWYVEGVEKSTAPTFTRTSDDIGKRIYAIVTVSAPGFADVQLIRTATSSSTPAFTADPFSIVGTTFGETFALSDPEPFKNLPQFEHANWTYRYSWDGSSAPTNTASTYVVPASSIGGRISVRVTVSSPVFGEFTKTVTTSTPLLPGAPLTRSTDTTLDWTGDLLPGSTVTAIEPSYSETPVTNTYVWQTSSDGGTTWVTEAGVTTRTFATGLIHSNRMLRVTVTGTRLGNGTVTSTSAPAQILEGDVIRVLGIPTLTGTARVGSTLKTTAGAWSAGATPGIQWLLNGRAIPGATGPTYTPLPTHAGDEISVRVTGRQAGKLDVVADTAAFTIARAAAPTSIKLPVISGSTTLAATPGVWSASGLTFHYQWRIDGVAVEGATVDSFVLPSGVTRSRVSVVISTERFGYESAQVTVTG